MSLWQICNIDIISDDSIIFCGIAGAINLQMNSFAKGRKNVTRNEMGFSILIYNLFAFKEHIQETLLSFPKNLPTNAFY